MWTEPDAPVLRCWREGKDWLNAIISQSYSELPERRFKYSREPRSGYFINRVFSTSQSSLSPILKYSPSYPSVVLTDLHRAFRTIIMLCVRVCVCVRHRRRHASFDFLILVFCFLCRGLQGVSTRVYLGDCAQVRFMQSDCEKKPRAARFRSTNVNNVLIASVHFKSHRSTPFCLLKRPISWTVCSTWPL